MGRFKLNFLFLFVLVILFASAGNLPAQFSILSKGSVITSLFANDVVVRGNYAYVSYETIGLCIYDLSRGSNPILVARTNFPGSPEGLVISGDYLYLATYGDGLRVYSISNPTNAINISHTNNGAHSWNLALNGNYLYLANDYDGLRIYDISNPTNLINVGHSSPVNFAQAFELTIAGNYLYLANGDDGFRIYDISTPTNAISVGHTNNGTAQAVTVSGNYAYVLHSSGAGFCVYDVSDPANPSKISQMTNLCSTVMFHGIVVTNTRAYATLKDGLHIYDISNPAAPLDVGHTNNVVGFYAPSGVTLAGNLIYVANQRDGLHIYSLAGPALAVDSVSSDSLRVSWPSNYYNFALQQTTNLNTNNWSEVTNPPVMSSNRNQVVLSPDPAGEFLRLKLQP